MTNVVTETIKMERVLVLLQGAVQGVGFRPFVYRLAVDLALSGYVCNSSFGVTIEAEGSIDRVQDFLICLRSKCPPQALIEDLQITHLPLQKDDRFVIRDSQIMLRPEAVILPDMGTCPQCLKEIFDPSDRHYRYPFTNCTHCGPRYSIIEHLPYDRKNTSMKTFVMCPMCQKEYDDPLDRRFHAQPNACPACGPQLQLVNGEGKALNIGNDALLAAVSALRLGKILALKGLGGFQLLVDAHNEHAVSRLRERKHRAEKPLAMMFPSLVMVKEYCEVSAAEERAISSAQAPIVLLSKKEKLFDNAPIACAVSLDNPAFGVMLPYTPLHHLLMKEFGQGLVATSANLSEEPMCIDNDYALDKLKDIADLFLIHDRAIVRPVDDSVGMVIKDRFSIVRRARGFAPLPILVNDHEGNILALGAQMKSAVALKFKNKVYLSQHIGDLGSQETMGAFTQSIESLRGLYPHPVNYVAVDMHPDYSSTRYGLTCKEPLIAIQHHHAHIVACMAENHLNGTILGLAWDGTGLGTDHTIWGSEFLVASYTDFERAGHLLPFRIPGSETAIHQPKRTALGLLSMLSDADLNIFKDLYPVQLFTEKEIENIKKMLTKGLQSPMTSSMGRLFDGVSALLGLCHQSTYEGQAAMLLENSIGTLKEGGYYSWTINNKNIIDWRPMMHGIIADIRCGTETPMIAIKFHNTLVEMAVDVAKRIALHQVVLSGGCFQNKYLVTNLIDRLRAEGFDPYWHAQVPTNDGGIALGQAVIAAARWQKTRG